MVVSGSNWQGLQVVYKWYSPCQLDDYMATDPTYEGNQETTIDNNPLLRPYLLGTSHLGEGLPLQKHTLCQWCHSKCHIRRCCCFPMCLMLKKFKTIGGG